MNSANAPFIAWLSVALLSTILALGACSGMSKKEQEAARQAELVKQEQLRKQAAERKKKEAEARKKAAEKQKLEAEDKPEVKIIEPLAAPPSEQLPEPAAEEAAPVEAAPTTFSEKDLEIPTEPNTYLITVQEKTRNHPLFGVGSNMGFAVNGIEGNYVVVKRGDVLTFRVRTDVKHDFYLTTSPMGWGAAAYTKGVDGQFTHNGDVSLKVTDATPDLLYFGCRNHNSMGGKIVVVPADANVGAIKVALEKERLGQLEKNKTKKLVAVTLEKLKQKIAYVEMLLQFKGGNMDADHKAQVVTMLYMAKNQESAKDLEGAYASAQAALALFNQKVPGKGMSQEEIAQNQEEINDLLITLEAFIDAHKASYDQAVKSGSSKAVDYDHDVVGSLIAEAKKLSEEHKFRRAKNRIQRAENLVNRALNDMLGSRTLVYELKFATKEDEYNYEVKRYFSYEELVPVAIEVKKPSESAIKLANTYIDKGKFFMEKSKESAAAGRWDEALVVIRDATIEVRRGLRMLGVSM